jgi:predicted DCC family thiol-disulfide oxidoreductase YuxK
MSANTATAAWEVEVFYDGACPLCRREVAFLRKLDCRGRIRFTDLAAADFALPAGRSIEELMAEIHGRLPDGTWITGVEVFRRLYGAVGFRWLVAPTRLPGVSHLMDWGYRVFARNRLKLTGRCTTECRLPESSTSPSP